MANGCLEYYRPIITNACPSKRSQESRGLKLVPILLRMEEEEEKFCHFIRPQRAPTSVVCVSNCVLLLNLSEPGRALIVFNFSYVCLMHLSMLSRRGGRGGQVMGWGFDCLCCPWGRTFNWSCSPGGRDIWLPTRTKKTETEHMFPLPRMRARSGKSGKSWRPLTRVSMDFTVLSSNFVCFSVFLINWTS